MPPEFLRFTEIGAAGCYVATGINFLRPTREMSTLPDGWTRQYVQSGLAAYDPALRWAATNFGFRRWSELDDPHGVLEHAATWGLRYGASLSVFSHDGQKRSFCFLAREDREITDDELSESLSRLEKLHGSHPKSNLTRAEIEVLEALLKGKRIKNVAFDLGVTEGAIKQRLRNARGKLGANTATQAATMAKEMGLM